MPAIRIETRLLASYDSVMKKNGKPRIRTYTVTMSDGTTRCFEGTRLEETKTGIMIWNGRKAVIGFDWSELKSIL
ncbi:MAG: hypothetical protein WB869_00630 [Candidatus Acidiferrales bacterium]